VGVAHQRDAGAALLGALGRGGHRFGQRHRAGGARGVENEEGLAVAHDARAAARVHLVAVDHFQIARHARDAVPVTAAQIGPDQGLRHHRGILGAHALGLESLRDEALQLVVSNADCRTPHRLPLSYPGPCGAARYFARTGK
jgi:hypothetical protein